MAKAVFLSGYITFDSTTLYVTNLDYNEDWELIDTTDLSDALGDKSWIPSFGTLTFSAEAWKDINSAMLSSGAIATFVLNFVGYQLSGSGIIKSANINAVFDAAVRYSLTGIINGSITEQVAS